MEVYSWGRDNTKIQLTTGNPLFPAQMKNAHRPEGIIPNLPLGVREGGREGGSLPLGRWFPWQRPIQAVLHIQGCLWHRLVHFRPTTPGNLCNYVKSLPRALERDFAELVSRTGSWHKTRKQWMSSTMTTDISAMGIWFAFLQTSDWRNETSAHLPPPCHTAYRAAATDMGNLQHRALLHFHCSALAKIFH